MIGDRKMASDGYRWDVFARFPCNASGVRVAVRKTAGGAMNFAKRFGRTNRVNTWTKIRLDRSVTRTPARAAIARNMDQG
jgi:hypothetical protein